MKANFVYLILLAGLIHAMAFLPANAAGDSRPRVIATTDGEGDDKSSMVRFLLYSNEFDLEGIVYSSSTFHWDGTRWSGKAWIQEYIGHYSESYQNLKEHDANYPSPEALRDLIYIGNIKGPGTMDADTPGSNRISEILLDDDPRPVYLQAWGGTNTIARALWKIQHEHPEAMGRVSKKAVLYIIQNQDITLREYIQPNWPELQILASYEQFRVFGYSWKALLPTQLHPLFQELWITENIREGHGPLCAIYKVAGTNANKGKIQGDFNSEGDSPSFLRQVDVGLRSLEHPSYGGWGGRFTPEANGSSTWMGAQDKDDLYMPVWRWLPAIQNDWAVRADWCIKPLTEANHPPQVRLAHLSDLYVNTETVTLQLDASPSTDPDGDDLQFRWWQYGAADTINQEVQLQNADQAQCDMTYNPYFARTDDTIHLISEVTDNGTPPLTRYARVIVTVRENTHQKVIRERLLEYAEEIKPQ